MIAWLMQKVAAKMRRESDAIDREHRGPYYPGSYGETWHRFANNLRALAEQLDARSETDEQFILQMLNANTVAIYGLEIVELSKGRLKRGTVYVTLDKMEDDGVVVSRADVRLGEPGPAARLYVITEAGRRALAEAS